VYLRRRWSRSGEEEAEVAAGEEEGVEEDEDAFEVLVMSGVPSSTLVVITGLLSSGL